MDPFWLHLPGPALMTDRIVQDLRDRRSVVLHLPRGTTEAVRSAIGARVHTHDLWLWRIATVEEQGSPIQQLGRSFDLPGLVEIGDLLTEESLDGAIIWVEVNGELQWKAWRSFLLAFEHEARNAHERGPLFCIALTGDSDAMAPIKAPGTVTRIWRGVFSRLDLSFFASYLGSGRSGRGGLEHRLRVAVVAEVAGFDLGAVEELVDMPLDVLLKPDAVLAQLAQRRGWTKETCENPNWSKGMCDVVEGRDFIHSAVLCAKGETVEIVRRIWRAEVAVLFPHIEDRRIELTGELSDLLETRLPIETPFGRIEDVADLEIGHISMLVRDARIPGRRKAFIASLARVRHCLAHLQAADEADVCALISHETTPS